MKPTEIFRHPKHDNDTQAKKGWGPSFIFKTSIAFCKLTEYKSLETLGVIKSQKSPSEL